MSKVLSDEAKKVVYTVTKTLIGIKCDRCKKVINATMFKKDESKYYEVTTGHHDWGNDSYESRRRYDICPECIIPFTNDYLSGATGSEYIEIQTDWAGIHDITCDPEYVDDDC